MEVKIYFLQYSCSHPRVIFVYLCFQVMSRALRPTKSTPCNRRRICEFNVPGKTEQREKNPFHVRLSSKLNRATNSYLYDFNFEDWMFSVKALSYN